MCESKNNAIDFHIGNDENQISATYQSSNNHLKLINNGKNTLII